MHYELPLIRPPSEAESLLIQITTGCSHHKCIFCWENVGKTFKVKDFSVVKEDIEEAASWGRPFERVFITDGDALIIPQKRLKPIFEEIRENLTSVRRVGLYGSAKAILRKSVANLKELQELGLGIVYMGLESGDDDTLKWMRKGVTAEQQLEAGKRVLEAGILLSTTLILGIAGTERGEHHILATADLLNRLNPHQIRVHTLMVLPGTPLYDMVTAGEFEVPDPFHMVQELGLLIQNIDLWDTPLLANHRSNYLPLVGLLANDREALLSRVSEVLTTRNWLLLRPEHARSI